MGYSARTLVEAVGVPTALVDPGGLVLVANARWRAAGGSGGPHAAEGTVFPGPDLPSPVRAALADAVRPGPGGDRPAEVRCATPTGDLLVRVTGVECDCGPTRFLVSTEPATAGGGTAGVGAADPADRVESAKSEFLALLGHEIRTPVTGVVGMVDLLRALPLDQEVREVVDGVHRSTQALKSMVDDLLDLARLETGRFELRIGEFSLRQVMEEVADPLQEPARKQGIALLVAVAPDLPARLLGDAGRLRQILTSLLGNAVRFTDHGEVVATAERDGDGQVLLTVSDTGPGLTPRDRARVLAPFTQADASAARTHEGAGLGLAIAARLVSRMGGTIEIDSVPGAGSTFRIRLPLPAPGAVPGAAPGAAPGPGGPVPALLPGIRRVAVDAPSTRTAQALSWLLTAAGAVVSPAHLDAGVPNDADAVLWYGDARDPAAARRAETIMAALGRTRRGIMISTTDPRGGGVVHGPAVITAPITLRRLVAAVNAERTGVRGAPISVPPFPAGRVLLAEDNEVNRGVFRRMIELLGVECDAVADGEAATVAALGDREYDVILMDVQMPRVDGLEATRRIRAAGQRTPILALTATALKGDRERCLAAGMDGHVEKPITLPELREALAPHLEHADGPPAVDFDRLRELEAELADRPLVLATVSTFLAELDGRQAALSDALSRQDRDGLRAMAHTLKSSSALLGAGTLAGACAAVERQAGAASAPALAALVATALRAAETARTALESYLVEDSGIPDHPHGFSRSVTNTGPQPEPVRADSGPP